MNVDRVQRQIHFFGYLTVAQPHASELRHLFLLGRQRVYRIVKLLGQQSFLILFKSFIFKYYASSTNGICNRTFYLVIWFKSA